MLYLLLIICQFPIVDWFTVYLPQVQSHCEIQDRILLVLSPCGCSHVHGEFFTPTVCFCVYFMKTIILWSFYLLITGRDWEWDWTQQCQNNFTWDGRILSDTGIGMKQHFWSLNGIRSGCNAFITCLSLTGWLPGLLWWSCSYWKDRHRYTGQQMQLAGGDRTGHHDTSTKGRTRGEKVWDSWMTNKYDECNNKTH